MLTLNNINMPYLLKMSGLAQLLTSNAHSAELLVQAQFSSFFYKSNKGNFTYKNSVNLTTLIYKRREGKDCVELVIFISM